jgi:hypothetical protein
MSSSGCSCKCKARESELSVPITNIAALVNALITNSVFVNEILRIAGPPLDYANFAALAPSDNPDPIAPGAAIEFPNIRPAHPATGITALSTSTFNLAVPGDYEIKFQASILMDGQIGVVVNGVLDPFSVAGRSAIASQISNAYTLRTTLPNTVISVNNPAGNLIPLTVTPFAGDGMHAVSAQLQITRLS